MKEITDQDAQLAIEKQQAIMEKIGEAYIAQLDDLMGHLHNQFVAFISESKVPLPHVALVLQILQKEIVDQAMHKYLGE